MSASVPEDPASIRCELVLDTSGLMCPLPLLRLKKTLLAMNSGDLVKVLATDPASVLDFGVFLQQAGHQLLGHWEQAGTLFFLVRKS